MCPAQDFAMKPLWGKIKGKILNKLKLQESSFLHATHLKFLPYIIKIFTRYGRNGTYNHNTFKQKKEITITRLVILAHDILVNLIDISTKYYQKLSKKIGVMERNRLRFHTAYEAKDQACIKQKERKQELSFLHATCLYGLIHKPTKYYPNMSKHVGVMAPTNSTLKGK